jgi:hypothetical protein
MKKSRETDAFLSSKRARKYWRRRQRLSKAEHASKERKDEAARTVRASRLYAAGWRLSEHLQRLGESATTKFRGPVADVKIPKIFSIIEAPELALQTIGNLVAAGARTDVFRVEFDHSEVENFDLAAEAILMRVAREIEIERDGVEHEVSFEGTYPTSEAAKRFGAAMGIGVYLNAQRRAKPVSDGSIRVFQQRQRVPVLGKNGAPSSEKADVIEAFADHINVCLDSINKQLTPTGRTDLCAYTGEVIDNVEEHAGSRAWFIASYLDTAVSPPTCEVTIYNFGRSFAASFSDLPHDNYARGIVAPYIDQHKKGGFFKPSWKEDDLLTLVALQAGVSSKSLSDLDTRGHGTIDLIEFFEDVYEGCKGSSAAGARMALLSGNTYILFDGTYRLAKDREGRPVIAFNRENSLGNAPDPKYVRHLDGVFFPGTVVSIRFPLQQTDQADSAVDGIKS